MYLFILSLLFYLESIFFTPDISDPLHMRAAPEVIPPILLCLSMISETDVGSMEVEAELSH